jgi:hypothetical protein
VLAAMVAAAAEKKKIAEANHREDHETHRD